ncbi:hypothetical protein [Microbacterium xanthum]|uniref:hypothetical protein n=1 Tax=Microbacterium xanthum TaxID=3079794 RepID=UPI002AD4DECA|nr:MULTISPECIES: hypothetical protein [unclassified Microbacterium]MDZ8171706.1 hypothetical protein [Microbacterium sp. KSW-48]MDZ8200191.1 hypothetical protein [Microbacterium sp. SSW1-59]
MEDARDLPEGVIDAEPAGGWESGAVADGETADASRETAGSPDLTLENQEPDPGVDVGPVEGAAPDTDPDLANVDEKETS